MQQSQKSQWEVFLEEGQWTWDPPKEPGVYAIKEPTKIECDMTKLLKVDIFQGRPEYSIVGLSAISRNIHDIWRGEIWSKKVPKL